MDTKKLYSSTNLFLSAEDKKRIVKALRRKMRTQKEIADTLDLPYHQVVAAFEKLGVSSKDVLNARKLEKQLQHLEAIKRMAAEGTTAGDMAAKLGLSRGFVTNVLRKYEIIIVRQPRHGTVVEYNHFGCRCDTCTEYNRVRIEAGKASRRARKGDTPHGTKSGYVNWDCRCVLCKAAVSIDK